jgi:hypothetical protein
VPGRRAVPGADHVGADAALGGVADAEVAVFEEGAQALGLEGAVGRVADREAGRGIMRGRLGDAGGLLFGHGSVLLGPAQVSPGWGPS